MRWELYLAPTCTYGQVLAILELRRNFALPGAIAFVNVSLVINLREWCGCPSGSAKFSLKRP
jgi:hypothetical protein